VGLYKVALPVLQLSVPESSKEETARAKQRWQSARAQRALVAIGFGSLDFNIIAQHRSACTTIRDVGGFAHELTNTRRVKRVK
jgi:hypothetical protein